MDITETTMREFFQGVIDHVATLSSQAQRVSELEQRVNDLSNRISDLESQNSQLRQDLEHAQAHAQTVQQEADAHRHAAMAANEHVNALRETITSADHRVADLSTQLQSEQDSHNITKADLADARRAAQEWEGQYAQTKAELERTWQERDDARREAQDWQARANELQAKFDRLSSILSPPSVIANVA